MKVAVILMVGLLVLGVGFGLYYNLQGENEIMEEETQVKLYYGPVPEGYNEQYFRETGITQPS